MAVDVNVLTSAGDIADLSEYVTASVNPTEGRQLLLGVFNRHTTGGSNVHPTAIAGLSQTWVEVQKSPPASVSTNVMALWRAPGTSVSNGTVTITMPSTVLACSWILVELIGADGANPVVQAVESNGSPFTTAEITLAAFGSADNATFGFFGENVNEAISVGTGFTSLANPTTSAANGTFLGEWRNDNDTSVDASWPTSTRYSAIAVEIRAAAAGELVTPTNAALALVSFVPTVVIPGPAGDILLENGTDSYLLEDGSGVYLLEGDIAGEVSTPAKASVVTATFAPTVTASAHQTVTPTTVALTTARFAPTVSTPVLVTLVKLPVSTATFAPTVTASAHQSVTPTNVALVTTKFAPTVTATAHQTVTPITSSLATARFAPTVSTPVLATPTTFAVSTTAFAPIVTASNHQTVTPTTAALAIAKFVPTVTATAHQTVVPVNAAVTLATFVSTVTASDHKMVVPSVSAVSLSAFAPTVTASNHQIAIPASRSLSLTTFIPVVTAPNPQLVIPSIAALTLTQFAPILGAQQTATPTTAALVTGAFAPIATATDHKTVVPVNAVSTLSTFISTVTASDHKRVVPSLAAISTTTFAPSVTASNHQTAIPAKAVLTLSAFVSTVTASDHKVAVPTLASLATTRFAPTVSVLLGAPVWTTPLDTALIGTTPELKFTMPTPASAMHFNLQLDTVSTFDSVNLRDLRSDLDQTGWDFWNGTVWEAVTSAGVSESFAGNEARHTVQSPLSSMTWHRRVRAGV